MACSKQLHAAFIVLEAGNATRSIKCPREMWPSSLNEVPIEPFYIAVSQDPCRMLVINVQPSTIQKTPPGQQKALSEPLGYY